MKGFIGEKHSIISRTTGIVVIEPLLVLQYQYISTRESILKSVALIFPVVLYPTLYHF